ncbi:ABC transporter permease, partial [Streptomyces sp. NPDC058442]
MTVRSSRPRVAAPWVRTRLRAAPGAALALALLVAVTAFLAAVLPRAVDRYGDAGLHQALRSAGPDSTGVQVAAPLPTAGLSQEEQEEAVRGDALRGHRSELLALAGRSLPLDPHQSSSGVRTSAPQEVSEPWLPRPDGLPPSLHLLAQNGLADHSQLREGRLPKAPDTVTVATTRVEGAVTTDTAGDLNIEVGSVLTFPGAARAPLEVRITGIVEPRDPRGAYWSADPLMRTPGLTVLPGDPDLRQYWLGALLLPPDAAPALLGTAGEPWQYWWLAPSVPDLHGYDVPRLTSAVAAVESGPVLQRMREATTLDIGAYTELDDVLTDYTRLRTAIGPLVSVAAFGTGTVAVVVLLMAGGLAADRRGGELTLLRARGGSLPGVTGRLLAETAVVAVPAAALGLAAVWLTVCEARPAFS